MSVTLAVFQALMSWLNADANVNIELMSVTLEVFQALMFWLNTGLPENNSFMLSTALTSQFSIGTAPAPCMHEPEGGHKPTAVLRSDKVVKTPPVAAAYSTAERSASAHVTNAINACVRRV